jgi:hypothetical protein
MNVIKPAESADQADANQADVAAKFLAKFEDIVSIVGLPESDVIEFLDNWPQVRPEHINGVPLSHIEDLVAEHRRLREEELDPCLPETSVCSLCP